MASRQEWPLSAHPLAQVTLKVSWLARFSFNQPNKTLASWTEEHDLFAFEEIATRFHMFHNRLDFLHRQFRQYGVVTDLLNCDRINDTSFPGGYQLPDFVFPLFSSSLTSTKPNLDFKTNLVFLLLKTMLPILDYTSFTKPIFDTPRPDLSKLFLKTSRHFVWPVGNL